MSFPTVAVTVTLRSEEGIPYEGVTVTAHLDRNDRYQGFVIACDARAVTDANGVAVLNLFPNHPTTGLGTTGSIYHFHASIPHGKNLNEYAQVPNSDCSLDAIAAIKPVGSLSAAEAAAASAAASAAEASASAAEAAASAASVGTAAEDAQQAADDAQASADAAANSESQAAGYAVQAANSAAAAFNSEQAAFSSEQGAIAARDAAQAAAGQAATARDAAQGYANAAGASATAADQSEAEAEAAADAAEGYAGAAHNSSIFASTAAEDAAERADVAQDSADAAAISAGTAAEAANSALAIYGSVDEVQDAVTDAERWAQMAAAQAGLSASYAQAAGSVVQQDLSGVTGGALHRAGATALGLFVYDASKDSDGGAWVGKVDVSYLYEPLNGAYLPPTAPGLTGWPSELQARCYGATVGAELIVNEADRTFSSDTGFWTKGTGWVITDGRASHSGGVAEYLVRNGLYPASGGIYKWELDVLTADTTNFLQIYDGAGLAYSPVMQAPGHYVFYIPGNLGTTARIRAVGNCACDNLSIKQVTALTTTSGAYYQINTDGRFYRLWKNRIPNSEDFSAWGRNSIASVTADADGFGDFVLPAAGSGNRNITLGGVHLQGITGVLHYRVKGSAGIPWACINTGGGYAFFNVVAGTVGTVSAVLSGATIAPVTDAGWPAGYFDISVVCSASALATQSTTALAFGTSDGSFNCVADGVSGVHVARAYFASEPAFSGYERRTTSGLGQDETFRGNKARFPKMAALVLEQTRLTIYDLLEPGRPMWKVILRGPNAVLSSAWDGNNSNVALSLHAREGLVYLGTSTAGSFIFDFARDRVLNYYNGSVSYQWHGNLGTVNALAPKSLLLGFGPLPASAVHYAISMTTYPDAPVDPVTGVQVPTVLVCTAGGLAVIKHDGSVVLSASVGAYNGGTITPYMLMVTGQSAAFSYAFNPKGLSTSFGLTSLSGGVPGNLTTGGLGVMGLYSGTRGVFGSRLNGSRFGQTRLNEMNLAAGMTAFIGNDHNTGWMVGDVRRCLMSDTAAGVATGQNLCANGSFAANLDGWAQVGVFTSTAALVGGEMHVTATAASGMQAYAFTSVPGRRYRVTLNARLVSGPGHVYAGFCSPSGNDIPGSFTATTSSASAVQLTAEYTATETTSRIYGRVATAGSVGGFDDFVVAEVVADRSYKVKPATIYGTLTKTPVATGAQLVFYGGFSNDLSWNAEYVSNGTFTTNTAGWVAGLGVTTSTFTAAGGVATLTKAGGDMTPRFVTQLTGLTVGAQYTVTFTHTNPSTDDRVLLFTPNSDGTGGTVILMTASGTTVTATAATMYLSLMIGQTMPDGATVNIDNVSVKRVTAGATPAANFAQEAYSADLDFPNGFAVHTWLSLPSTMPADNFAAIGPELLPSLNFAAAPWVAQGSVSNITANSFRTNGTAGEGMYHPTLLTANKQYRLTVNWTRTAGNSTFTINNSTSQSGTLYTAPAGVTSGVADVAFIASGGQAIYFRVGTAVDTITINTISVREVGNAWAFDRSAASGPYYRLGCDAAGKLVGEVYDGTTTRTVTTTPAYLGAVFCAELVYATTGSLSIRVNGEQIAKTDGTPLLTLASATAVLTLGNSRTLSAAFPGGIALLRATASVPTEDQSRFLVQQERQMFRDGALVTLPDSLTLTDMDYDPALERWRVMTTTNESEFSGLTRVSVTPVPLGTYNKVAARSGIKLAARVTNYTGVDVTMPSQNLKEELLRRAEDATARRRGVEVYDYGGGFTANISNVSNGTNQFAAVANYTAPTVGASVVGARFTAPSGVAAGSEIGPLALVTGNLIPNWSTIPFTAAVTGAAISFVDFILPPGLEARAVAVGGTLKQEGSTKDYTRLCDGFRERVRFNVAPGNTTWVQLHARRWQ